MNRLKDSNRAHILSLLIEGVGILSTARIARVGKQTVIKLRREMAAWARDFHDDHVREVRPKQVQCDESWTIIRGREPNRTLDWDDAAGNTWVWTAIDRDSKLLISWLPGKRTILDADTFLRDLETRCLGSFDIVTDGCFSYPRAIGEVFKHRNVRHVVVNPHRPTSATTNHVERHNLTMRRSISGMRRDAALQAKTYAGLCDALSLYMVHYNFCRRHKSLRMTPAMAAGLTPTRLTIHDLLVYERESFSARAERVESNVTHTEEMEAEELVVKSA